MRKSRGSQSCFSVLPGQVVGVGVIDDRAILCGGAAGADDRTGGRTTHRPFQVVVPNYQPWFSFRPLAADANFISDTRWVMGEDHMSLQVLSPMLTTEAEGIV
jgi:hypothetical protein